MSVRMSAETGAEMGAEMGDVEREELLISVIGDLLEGARHVAVGVLSPIPGAGALLAASRSGGRVTIIGSDLPAHRMDGGVELFDMAADGDGAVSRASASTVLRGLLGASYAQAEMDRLFGFFDGGGGTIDREQMFRMLDFAKYELCDESPRAPAAHTFEETKELLDGAPAPALSRQGSYRTLSIGSAKTHVEKLERLADVEGGYTARNPERWQVLYCGNSKTLKAEVAEVARSLGLTSRFESFEH